jgi:7,8-dihydropterin-6-yl-methyl-4-(beta-D-ribofuranosyl)aminobenzene 5'-phosphate synthase
VRQHAKLAGDKKMLNKQWSHAPGRSTLKKIIILSGTIVVLVVAFGLYLAVGNAQAVAQIDREWQTTPVQRITNLGSTRSLEILPLFEQAAANANLEAEHGVSYLVKTDHLNILLDVGMTPARLSHNMQALGVSGKDFDAIFISHTHPDHIGGTRAWDADTLIVGDPAIDLRGKPVYLPAAMSEVSGQPIVVTQPMKIADGVASIGPIAFPDFYPFSFIPHVYGHNTEQALAVNVEGKGIVLITGCGHQTVERMVARAQALFGEPIAGIVGGLHYQDLTLEQTQPHMAFIAALHPQIVAISPHDSSPEVMQAFRATFPGAYQDIQVGHVISFGQAAH